MVATSVTFAKVTNKPHVYMQGTAITEAEEFYNVYKLNVVQIPSRLPNRRQDFAPRMFLCNEQKLVSIYVVVMQAYWRQRPVLIGTASVSESEDIFRLLKGTLWAPFEFPLDYWYYDLKGMRRSPGSNCVR